LDTRKRGILYGMALGDGGIYKVPNAITSRLVIGHGPAQLEYLEYKAKLLHSVLGGKPPSVYTYNSFNKRVGKTYTNHQLYKSDKYFDQMHRVLYPQGTKKYTKHLLDYLTDQSLALWYMDDGSGTLCKNNKTGGTCGCMTRIATYCSKEEAELLRDWFTEKYHITPKFDVDKRNNKYSLRFNTNESRVFVSIVYPYMFHTMKYKVEHVDKYTPRARDTLLHQRVKI
jgi:hypothetical protein